jgi:aryl-alcohol dehydrogenase-like predicted oxidoreductase
VRSPTLTSATISRRAIPGIGRSASAIGVALESGSLQNSGAVEGVVRLLRGARAHGVTTFELPSGAGADVLERAVATAFPTPDPALAVVSERSSEGLSSPGANEPAPPGTPAPVGSLQRAVEASNRRLDPQKVHLIDWISREGDGTMFETELARLRMDGVVDAVVRRVGGPSGEDGPTGRGALWSGGLSLLDDRTERRLGSLLTTPGLGFFARDPFDGGRLDGRRLTDAVSPRRPDVGPVRLRELEQEFAPVLALGFLTEGRTRTLAQAAIQHALRWPWVCSVLVPLPAPERMAEVLAAESTPPLSEAELDRLAAVRHRD